MTMLVQLSAEDLAKLVREAVREELVRLLSDEPATGPITEEELALARKRLRAMGYGT